MFQEQSKERNCGVVEGEDIEELMNRSTHIKMYNYHFNALVQIAYTTRNKEYHIISEAQFLAKWNGLRTITLQFHNTNISNLNTQCRLSTQLCWLNKHPTLPHTLVDLQTLSLHPVIIDKLKTTHLHHRHTQVWGDKKHGWEAWASRIASLETVWVMVEQRQT